MPRLKPVLKYPRISAALLKPGNALASVPVMPFGSKGVVRLLPGWECLGWARIAHTPPQDAVVFEKKECLPAFSHTNLGPGTYWIPAKPEAITIETS